MSGPSFLIKNKIKNQVGLSAIVLVHPDRLTVRKILTYNMMLMTLVAVISIVVYAHVFCGNCEETRSFRAEMNRFFVCVR